MDKQVKHLASLAADFVSELKIDATSRQRQLMSGKLQPKEL
jgi:hypothetical protein